MRAWAIGLIAVPAVAVSGAAVVAAVVASESAESPGTSPGQTATAGITGEAADEPSHSVEGDGNTRDTGTAVDGADPDGTDLDGTVIEGSKPYLTVIDGVAALPVPAPLPAVLAELTVLSVSLAPLPPQPGRRTELVEPGDGAAEENRGQVRTDPVLRNPLGFPGSETGPRDQTPAPGTHPDHGTRPGGGDDAVGGVDRGEGAPGDAPGRPAVPAPDSGRPPAAPPGPPVLGGPPVGPPPHADETGPPPHSGDTGRPPHAGAPILGRPPAIDVPAVDSPAIDPPADSDTPAVPTDGDTDPAEGSIPHPSHDLPTTR